MSARNEALKTLCVGVKLKCVSHFSKFNAGLEVITSQRKCVETKISEVLLGEVVVFYKELKLLGTVSLMGQQKKKELAIKCKNIWPTCSSMTLVSGKFTVTEFCHSEQVYI